MKSYKLQYLQQRYQIIKIVSKPRIRSNSQRTRDLEFIRKNPNYPDKIKVLLTKTYKKIEENKRNSQIIEI